MLGSPMGMGMEVPELHPDIQGVWKKCQMTNFTIDNDISSMKYAQKSVPGLADDGVPHGDGDRPIAPAPGYGSKIATHHADQHKKLKELSEKKFHLMAKLAVEGRGQMCFSIKIQDI